MKRLFDVAVAGLALLLLAPLLAVVAGSVRIQLGRPVLYTQQRCGLHGQPFWLYKFRTMHDAYDAHGQPLADGERLRPFGQFLRRTSLDELPQLWNVLKGDMSLVGPRPLLLEYLPLYTPAQARRHEAKPGITGWAQVNGRNALAWEDKFTLDVWYVDHCSFALDLKILLLTVWRVLRAAGISQSGHVTMAKFRGSAR
jgi:sugar transferase EpsL